MFLELKHLSLTMPKKNSIHNTQQDLWMNKVDACGLNMHKILASELNSDVSEQHPGGVWRVYTISANIFLCLFLRKTMLGSPVLKYLTGSLISALDNEATTKTGVPASVLLWVLFLGGSAAEGSTQREWFMNRLPGLLLLLSMKTWKDAQDQLALFPYVDGCAVPFEKIWREVSLK